MTVFEAAVFLYCQAQVLYKARGIPAWRTHLIPLMIVASDLLEGIGPLAFMIGFPQGFPMPPGGIALIIVNSVLCCSYREGANKYAPPLEGHHRMRSRYPLRRPTGTRDPISSEHSFSDYPAVDLYDSRGRHHLRWRLLEIDGYSTSGIFRGFLSSKDAATRHRQLRRPCPARRMAALA